MNLVPFVGIPLTHPKSIRLSTLTCHTSRVDVALTVILTFRSSVVSLMDPANAVHGSVSPRLPDTFGINIA